MMLSLAPPLAAQGRAPAGRRAERLGPALTQREGGPLFSDQARGLIVTRQEFVRQDGSAATRTRLIGSVPVDDSLDIGVGLFSIVGQTEKETVRLRTDPQRDVRSRDGRMAAIGFALRFDAFQRRRTPVEKGGEAGVGADSQDHSCRLDAFYRVGRGRVIGDEGEAGGVGAGRRSASCPGGPGYEAREYGIRSPGIR